MCASHHFFRVLMKHILYVRTQTVCPFEHLDGVEGTSDYTSSENHNYSEVGRYMTGDPGFTKHSFTNTQTL